MRSLAVLTTTAAIALLGVANAQSTDRAAAPAAPAAPSAEASTADPLDTALEAYASYQMDISELRVRRLSAAPDLEGAIDQAVSHNRDALSRGWIAYGAQTAMQSTPFVEGVRRAAQYYGRDAVIWAMSADTSYARQLGGSSDAVRLVLDSAAADGARIIAVADRYQEQAYALQRLRWGNQVAPQQAQRVQRVRSLSFSGSASGRFASIAPRLAVTPTSLSPMSDPTVFGGRRFWDSVGGGAQVVEASSSAPAHWRVDVPRGEAVNRMLSIAAIEALDGRTQRISAVDQLLSEPRSRDCIEMAQLQLYQCMSAARFRYENAFCLGQHAMRDVGRCITAIAQPDTTAMAPNGSGGDH